MSRKLLLIRVSGILAAVVVAGAFATGYLYRAPLGQALARMNQDSLAFVETHFHTPGYKILPTTPGSASIAVGTTSFETLRGAIERSLGVSATSSKPAATAAPAPATAPAVKKAASTPAISDQTAVALALPKLQSALVNVICIQRGTSSIRSISGSGVIIDPRGIILTAAHVAQMLLLAEHPGQTSVTCSIRTGSPAAAAYTASTIFVSPSWIASNPRTLVEAAPTGTGENDFAFLAITGSATNAPLPAAFPFVPLTSATPTKGEPVVIGSYAAEFLSSTEVRTDLTPTLVFGAVQDRYTFGTNTVDLLSLGGTAAAQEGSSGGGALDKTGSLIGLITTSSSEEDFTARDLHAITPDHIRRSFEADWGQDLDLYLERNTLTQLVNNFSGESADLAGMLNRTIKKGQ